MQSKAGTGSALSKKTDEIRHAAEQGAALIRQLMTVGREEPGAPPSVCFDHVVVDLEHLLRHLLGEQVVIETDLCAQPGRVGITSAQAQQIILNLAINARDAMPGDGVLRIESRFRKPQPADHRIFERFLDEVGELPADLQAKMLRALQEKKSARSEARNSFPSTCEYWRQQTVTLSMRWRTVRSAEIFISGSASLVSAYLRYANAVRISPCSPDTFSNGSRTPQVARTN